MVAVPQVHGVVVMAFARIECVDAGLGLFNLRATTGDAHVVLAFNETELDRLMAQARDAKVSMLRWRRENACDDEEETYPDDWASS